MMPEITSTLKRKLEIPIQNLLNQKRDSNSRKRKCEKTRFSPTRRSLRIKQQKTGKEKAQDRELKKT
jgi:hypothetical protein